MLLPEPIQDLINAFSRLPGVGPKTASRLTFYLLRSPNELSQALADALYNLKSGTTFCQTCFNITVAGRTECEICASSERDASLICVVEEPLDVLALERTAGYEGRYHVLHGALSPIEGIGPEDLRVRELVVRIKDGDVRELILATNPSMEATTLPPTCSSSWWISTCASRAWRAVCLSAVTWSTLTRTRCCVRFQAGRIWGSKNNQID